MNTSLLSKKIGERLLKKGLTLSTAESCTGGLVGHLLTQVAGSSDYYLGGVIAYSNQVKQHQLKVPATTLKRYGAVSSQTARELSKGCRQLFKSDLSLSITGIAGPTGGTKSKPVGLVYFGFTRATQTKHFKKIFKGTRTQVKKQAAEWALKKVYGFI